jgi:hypothetical protein
MFVELTDALLPKATASRNARPSQPAANLVERVDRSGSCGLPLPQTTAKILRCSTSALLPFGVSPATRQGLIGLLSHDPNHRATERHTRTRLAVYALEIDSTPKLVFQPNEPPHAKSS